MLETGVWDTAWRTVRCTLGISCVLAYDSARALARGLAKRPADEVSVPYVHIAATALKLSNTRLEVQGLSNLDPGQAYVIVSNHESNWDALAILAALANLSIRFVVKRQIRRIPLLGLTLEKTGCVIVDRKPGARDLDRLRHAMEERSNEVSMLFFAEGTRARDGAFREFKKGAFIAALQRDLPILPVAVAGAYGVCAPSSLWIRRGTIVVNIGKPLKMDPQAPDARGRFLKETHATVAELRREGRALIRSLGEEPGGKD